jgi:hypothetical protein
MDVTWVGLLWIWKFFCTEFIPGWSNFLETLIDSIGFPLIIVQFSIKMSFFQIYDYFSSVKLIQKPYFVVMNELQIVCDFELQIVCDFEILSNSLFQYILFLHWFFLLPLDMAMCKQRTVFHNRREFSWKPTCFHLWFGNAFWTQMYIWWKIGGGGGILNFLKCVDRGFCQLVTLST